MTTMNTERPLPRSAATMVNGATAELRAADAHPMGSAEYTAAVIRARDLLKRAEAFAPRRNSALRMNIRKALADLNIYLNTDWGMAPSETDIGYGDPDALLADGFNPVEQLRVPRGNGRRSGRWVDMPWTQIDELQQILDTFELDEGLIPENAEGAIDEAFDKINALRAEGIEADDPDFTAEVKSASELLEEAADEVDKAGNPGTLAQDLRNASHSLDEFSEIDMTFLDEENRFEGEGDLGYRSPEELEAGVQDAQARLESAIADVTAENPDANPDDVAHDMAQSVALEIDDPEVRKEFLRREGVSDPYGGLRGGDLDSVVVEEPIFGLPDRGRTPPPDPDSIDSNVARVDDEIAEEEAEWEAAGFGPGTPVVAEDGTRGVVENSPTGPLVRTEDDRLLAIDRDDLSRDDGSAVTPDEAGVKQVLDYQTPSLAELAERETDGEDVSNQFDRWFDRTFGKNATAQDRANAEEAFDRVRASVSEARVGEDADRDQAITDAMNNPAAEPGDIAVVDFGDGNKRLVRVETIDAKGNVTGDTVDRGEPLYFDDPIPAENWEGRGGSARFPNAGEGGFDPDMLPQEIREGFNPDPMDDPQVRAEVDTWIDSGDENDLEVAVDAAIGWADEMGVLRQETLDTLFGDSAPEVREMPERERMIQNIMNLQGVSRAEAERMLNNGLTSSLRAAAAPADPEAPPAAHFNDPRLSEPTALTVDNDGHVYGHLATWDTCHLTHSQRGRCVKAPRSNSGYAYFHTGSVRTQEGSEIPVGRITLDTGHAEDSANPSATLAHYDNTGTVIADVVAGEDKYGIWVSGSLRPGISASKVRSLRSSPLSGDWRRIGTNLELVAALAVNVPGFPVPRPKGMVASGAMTSLVAAGMLPPRKVRRPGTPGALSMDDLRYLKRLAARERAEEDERKMQTLDAAATLSRKLRAQQMAARVKSTG